MYRNCLSTVTFSKKPGLFSVFGRIHLSGKIVDYNLMLGRRPIHMNKKRVGYTATTRAYIWLITTVITDT